MGMQEPAQVDTDAKRIAVELQRDAAAKVEFEIEAWRGLVVGPEIVAVVANEICGTGRDTGVIVVLAIRCRTRGGTVARTAAAEDAADDSLIAPGSNIVRGDGKAEVAGVILETAFELGVIAESDEGAMEVAGIHDGVADAGVQERRKIPEGVIDVIGLVPGGVAGAEAFLGITGGRGQVNVGDIVQQVVGKVSTQVRKDGASPYT